MILLKNQTLPELTAALADLRPSDRFVRVLQSSAVRRGIPELPTEMPNVARRLLEQVRERVSIPHLKLVEKVRTFPVNTADEMIAARDYEALERLVLEHLLG